MLIFTPLLYSSHFHLWPRVHVLMSEERLDQVVIGFFVEEAYEGFTES